MSKYIDADALVDYLEAQDKKYKDGLTTREIIVLIKNYPAANVEQVLRWINLPEPPK